MAILDLGRETIADVCVAIIAYSILILTFIGGGYLLFSIPSPVLEFICLYIISPLGVLFMFYQRYELYKNSKELKRKRRIGWLFRLGYHETAEILEDATK